MRSELMTDVTRERIEGCSGSTALGWTGHIFRISSGGYRTSFVYNSEWYKAARINAYDVQMIITCEEMGTLLDDLDKHRTLYKKPTKRQMTAIDRITFAKVVEIFGIRFLVQFKESVLEQGRDDGKRETQRQIQEALGL